MGVGVLESESVTGDTNVSVLQDAEQDTLSLKLPKD